MLIVELAVTVFALRDTDMLALALHTSVCGPRYHLGWPGACWLNLLTEHRATGFIKIYINFGPWGILCLIKFSLRVYFAGRAADKGQGCGNAHQSMLYTRDSQEHERHTSHSFFFWLAASISCFSATGSWAIGAFCVIHTMPSEHDISAGVILDESHSAI